jgi:hypothetical protein
MRLTLTRGYAISPDPRIWPDKAGYKPKPKPIRSVISRVLAARKGG